MPQRTATIFLLALLLAISTACATKRYGRMVPLSETEKSLLSCEQIDLEIARADEFVRFVREERRGISGSHVLGFIGDLGIGNVMEGDDAEESGERRLQDLKNARIQKGCNQVPTSKPQADN